MSRSTADCIVPEVVRVRLASGQVYAKDQVIRPDCGYRPPDFVIVGFGFWTAAASHMGMIGYHTAASKRKLIFRGCWPVEDVRINPAVNPTLDALIASANRIGAAP